MASFENLKNFQLRKFQHWKNSRNLLIFEIWKIPSFKFEFEKVKKTPKISNLVNDNIFRVLEKFKRIEK